MLRRYFRTLLRSELNDLVEEENANIDCEAPVMECAVQRTHKSSFLDRWLLGGSASTRFLPRVLQDRDITMKTTSLLAIQIFPLVFYSGGAQVRDEADALRQLEGIDVPAETMYTRAAFDAMLRSEYGGDRNERPAAVLEYLANDLISVTGWPSLRQRADDPNKVDFELDLSHLRDVPVRHGFHRVGGVLRMVLHAESGRFQFESLNDETEPGLPEVEDFVATWAMYGTCNIHLASLHFGASDNLVSRIMLRSVGEDSPVRRLLSPLYIETMAINEKALVTLLPSCGVTMLFNCTKGGAATLLEDGLSRPILDLLDVERWEVQDLGVFRNNRLLSDIVKYHTHYSAVAEDFVREMYPGEEHPEPELVEAMAPFSARPVDLQRVIRCLLMIPVWHELCSNPQLLRAFGNPFSLNTRTGDAPFGVQDVLQTATILYTTGKTSTTLRALNATGVDDRENALYAKYLDMLKALTFDSETLQPSKLESSIRW